jgi:putative transposase
MNDKSGQDHRRSIRLEGYDYAESGAYFITVLTRRRICLFGTIIDDEIVLNEAGQIVQKVWNELPKHFSSLNGTAQSSGLQPDFVLQ